ncbi:hypothetical protein FJTKL_02980 [Diaporthe vaccinii]|uniref:Uncharacterized protein n=1 Tax=Diaporthe vaccinii TaxID=105482 RepID=A0ABR4DWF4_9PEZI
MATNGAYGIEGWFPDSRDSWRLDAITLLAVIGESEIEAHSQAIEASALCLLPRILPAPQALLKPSRPLRMPDYPAKVAGVYSGVVLDTLGFFANIIHPLDDLPTYGFKVIKIKHRDGGDPSVDTTLAGEKGNTDDGSSYPMEDLRRRQRRRDGSSRSQSTSRARRQSSTAYIPDIEQCYRIRQQPREKSVDPMSETFTALTEERPVVTPKWSSPASIISVASFVLTGVIIGMIVYWKDGVALLAVGIVSLATSIVGYASWWLPVLMVRARRDKVTAGDIVIRTQQGGFILVLCSDEVARELYAGTAECEYHVGDRAHKLLMELGTAMLMVSIVLLGNVGFEGQTMVGASYIVLNGAYWLASMVSKEHYWDLSRYEWRDVTPRDARRADRTTDPNDMCDGFRSFTRTLWYVIRETKSTRWAERSGAAPGTRRWRQWLREAEENARAGNRRWAAVRRRDHIFADDESDAMR